VTIRTSEKKVTFRKPFTLKSVDEVLPAGTFTVETDEELLGGMWFPAYRRILTLLHVPGNPGQAVITRVLTIDPNELDTALMRDRALQEAPVGQQDTHQETLKTATKQCREDADLQP